MARYAVGDLQGCMDSLEALLERLEFDHAKDQLWIAGDIVNRGPRSLDTLRWVRDHSHSVRAVLGNHDIHLLACAAGIRPIKKRDTLQQVLEAPDGDELIDWLRHQPVLLRRGRDLMVHAGLVPAWTPERAEQLAGEVEAALQGPDWVPVLQRMRVLEPIWADGLGTADRLAVALWAMTTIRFVDRGGAMEQSHSGPPGSAGDDWMPWFDHPERRSRAVRVICGHWSTLGLLVRDDVCALDTGVVWGGKLTAIRLDDGAIFEQKAVEPPAPHH